MNYYSLTPEQRENFDYDFHAMLENNPQPYRFEEAKKILAVVEGVHDEMDWHWIVETKDSRHFYTRGGCDYTGWDCQSWAGSVLLTQQGMTLRDAIRKLAKEWEKQIFLDGVVFSLTNQVKEQLKARTWRDTMDDEFGL